MSFSSSVNLTLMYSLAPLWNCVVCCYYLEATLILFCDLVGPGSANQRISIPCPERLFVSSDSHR
jgi:hypothetical protein